MGGSSKIYLFVENSSWWKRQEQQRTNNKQNCPTKQPNNQQQEEEQQVTNRFMLISWQNEFFFSQVPEKERSLPSGHFWDDALLRCAFRALLELAIREGFFRRRLAKAAAKTPCAQHPYDLLLFTLPRTNSSHLKIVSYPPFCRSFC